MSRNRWQCLDKLKSNHETALRYVHEQGIKICTDASERERSMRFLLPIFQVFYDEISHSSLSLIYLYRQSEQSAEFADFDGRCYTSADCDTSSIGLSVELIHANPDYTTMVIIHELAHLLRVGDENFFRIMDELVQRYNSVTNSMIVNDYSESEESAVIHRDTDDLQLITHHPVQRKQPQAVPALR